MSINDPVVSTFFFANIIYTLDRHSPVKGTLVEDVVGPVVEIVGKLFPILVPKKKRHFQIKCVFRFIHIYWQVHMNS